MTEPALDSGYVRSTLDAGVLRVTLDRPDKRNALTRAMYDDLRRCITHAGTHDTVRAVLIDAEGEMFCAGNDIADFQGGDPHAAEQPGAGPALSFIKALRLLDKPVVAAVQGQATGIGTTMLLHVDLVVAGESARFFTAFIDLGLVPEAGSSRLLPALMGHQNAARLLLAGDTLTAEEAERLGLIAYRVGDDEIEAKARALVERLAAKPPVALAYTKQLMRDGRETPSVNAQIEQEARLFAERLASDEVREIMQRFMNRKKG